MFPHAYCTF
jgi:hypothetical protein